VYSFIEKKDKTTCEVVWRLRDDNYALLFPPVILAVYILQAVTRDFQITSKYYLTHSGPIMGEDVVVMGGPWNYFNGIADILNIIAITGWVGITIRQKTKKDSSQDMLWSWIIAYTIWNFTYTYNVIPSHAFYAGLALLLAPMICSFTVGKDA